MVAKHNNDILQAVPSITSFSELSTLHTGSSFWLIYNLSSIQRNFTVGIRFKTCIFCITITRPLFNLTAPFTFLRVGNSLISFLSESFVFVS